jgi:hypothetical protein
LHGDSQKPCGCGESGAGRGFGQACESRTIFTHRGGKRGPRDTQKAAKTHLLVENASALLFSIFCLLSSVCVTVPLLPEQKLAQCLKHAEASPDDTIAEAESRLEPRLSPPLPR